MQITRLNIERVRNLKAVALNELQPFNIFYGANGSGKTSILESIHLLATGRSFRTHIPKHYIQYEADDAIVFAQSASERIGMQKLASGEQLIKVNGDTIATQGQLAKLLPLQHIDPQSTDIIDHGAKPRRQLLDWLMFHVEPEFYFAWQYYSRALKQRNSLLKTRRNLSLADLEPWNKMLSDYGEILHSQRVGIVEQWNQFFHEDLQQLLPNLQIELEYSAGFHTEQGLLQDLIQQHQKDLDRRYTEYGPHRADLRLKTPFGNADDVLSRGQKKLLIMALKLSQIAMLHASNKETVVLLDDLTAELDLAAQQRLIERLSQLGSQVFMTTLDHASVLKHLHDLSIPFQLFHVVHGQVSLAAP
ncbi:DNA replication and repair protein RecF [Acinetobacter gyllenbergii]|uniref:DNA replication and repair protein RecF n=1 Tax=Acinetobacter gyllenbergii CIP 110306 = MTCC 11365 TaxID=1217657 RepID=A0A829HPT3_9GAMM|nr:MULTISPECIES: DNA replication/repair protein RecF [Acinetobacter]EPF94593.1 DNA replication and repair protein recF [Acinetobacter gyllenbergii CIP 110306 = MTCC 11365]EPH30734.1 DNA recombination and repair protein RecF [Acinetobacter gyllenbergii CIP 110306 = MTCC 11365]ESK38615.1 DNA replication and repair protein recF [Acinetobacter gyllenbergii NIPH 230]USA52640.1 DNA replication/repair protein RecF [Acinetobacter sp. C32I]GMA10414.1 DNA replication and repair protein RecF [Acinetobact